MSYAKATESEYIDILATVPIKLRCRIRNAADLADAYEQTDELIASVVDAVKSAITEPSVYFEDADSVDMEYDPDTYDPYPKETPDQAVRDLGEWRSAS